MSTTSNPTSGNTTPRRRRSTESLSTIFDYTAPPYSLEDAAFSPGSIRYVSLGASTAEPRREYHINVTMASENSVTPVPLRRLEEISTEACDSVLEPVSSYVHVNTAGWNSRVVYSILQKLINETTSESQAHLQYKYIVNSTIIQHAREGDERRRGMHSASGAYWNNEKDGMWSFKYGWDSKGFDVVVMIYWVWIG